MQVIGEKSLCSRWPLPARGRMTSTRLPSPSSHPTNTALSCRVCHISLQITLWDILRSVHPCGRWGCRREHQPQHWNLQLLSRMWCWGAQLDAKEEVSPLHLELSQAAALPCRQMNADSHTALPVFTCPKPPPLLDPSQTDFYLGWLISRA